jgi:hypothetical protein
MNGYSAQHLQQLRDQYKFDEVDEVFADKEYKEIDVLLKLQKNRVGQSTDLVFAGFKHTEINYKL